MKWIICTGMNDCNASVMCGSWVAKKPGTNAVIVMIIITTLLKTASRCFLKRHQTSFQFGAR